MFNKQTFEEILEIHGEKFGPVEKSTDTERLLYLYWDDECVEEDSTILTVHETFLEIVKHELKDVNDPESFETHEYFYVPYKKIDSVKILVTL